jgi:hypothetical protein
MDARADSAERKAAAMPGGLRRGVIAALVLVLAGALYLISVRGEALLVDLSGLGAPVFCF